MTESVDEEVLLFREPGEGEDGPTEPGLGLRAPRIVSVAGAKGGTGKSMLAANLAVYLASIGRQVILADADPEGANLHTIVGVPRPPSGRSWDPLGDEEPESVARPALIETAVPGLRLHHAGLDEAAAGEARRTRRAHLGERLRGLRADYVVADVGSGIASTLIDFHFDADIAVYVTVPEPTAIENTYRFLRYAFGRHLRRKITDERTRGRLLARIRALGGAPAPVDLWRVLEEDGDPMADPVRELMEGFSPALVLNQTRLRADLELGESIRSAARRRLGIPIEYLGHIDYDDTAWSNMRNRRVLLVESPGAKSAKSLEKIARRLLALAAGKRGRRERTVPPESHHDLLEIDRGATDEEVRRAFKRARDIYASDALAVYGLFEPEALDKVRMRIEEAFDVLLDPARRRPYELSVFPVEDDLPRAVPSFRARPTDLPPPPAITPETDFSGPLIRQVRESLGVDLRSVSLKTKVGMSYLEAIENDAFGSLPAPVYVRGFVTEFAKFLQLDAAHVSRTYVKRYRRYLEEKGEA